MAMHLAPLLLMLVGLQQPPAPALPPYPYANRRCKASLPPSHTPADQANRANEELKF